MGVKERLIAVSLACAVAAPMEGLRQKAYKDPVGIPTICFGSTKGVHMGDTKTVAECKAMLTEEMLETVNAVDRCVPNLPPNVLAAVSDAAYNVGTLIACNPEKSSVARRLKAGDIPGACNALLAWDKARIGGMLVALPGLTKRRQMERDLCLS